jgi:type III pantothenate kinase
VVRPEVPLSSLKVMIERPSELGADRLVNAVAARSFCQDAMIIIDFGTATTFDAVDADGNYLGGAIAPGVNLSLEALQNAAARLHGIRIRKAEKGIGSNTTAAMQSGLYYGYGGLVEGIVRQIKEELGGKAVVIATGGLSELFGRDNPLVDRVEPDLTVSGLMLLYEEYQKADA